MLAVVMMLSYFDKYQDFLLLILANLFHITLFGFAVLIEPEDKSGITVSSKKALVSNVLVTSFIFGVY